MGIVSLLGFYFKSTTGPSSHDFFVIPTASTASVASKRRLEFLGASLTNGYCDLGLPSQKNFTPSVEDSFLSHGRLIAHYLDAQVHIEAWSGKGLVRNSGAPNITSPNPYPTVFPLTLANNNATLWDFNSWIPLVAPTLYFSFPFFSIKIKTKKQ